MFKGVVIGVIGTLVLLAIGGWVVVVTGAVGVGADHAPGALERWAAMTSLHASIARQAPEAPPDIDASPDNLHAGLEVYAHNCMGCHGAADGKRSHVAEGLYQRPPQLAEEGVEDDPVGHTWWKVAHGIRWTGMPEFGSSLTDRQIWQVSLFLKHMDSLPKAVEESWKALPSVGG